jgi:hypothetical protein
MRTSLALTIALFASLAFPALAGAKGPSSATMSGPGISGVRHFHGFSEGGTGTPLGALSIDGGFFQQAFGQIPDPTRTTRPEGTLGPRYRIAYVVPGPGGNSVLHQDYYPYAKPAPLTFMEPGQTFWGGQRTHGGWFTARSSLTRRLGLPAQPPASNGTDVWRWSGIGAGILVFGAAIGLLLLRLRPRAKPLSA